MSAESAVERPARDTPRDEVERDLLQARALVEAAMFQHRRRSAASALVELPPEDEASGVSRRMLASARDEVSGVTRAANRLEGTLPELGRLAAAGVTVRMLCAPAVLRTPGVAGFLEQAQGQGIQIRVAASAPQELLLVDERMAMIRTGRQTLVTRAPAILGTLRGLFAGAWDAAGSATFHQRFGGRVWEGLDRQILGLLTAGYKDDVAARELGLSVRTYRRHVAEIMRDVGAASRFQAGVRAAELGLLSQSAVHDQPSMPPSIWKTAPVM